MQNFPHHYSVTASGQAEGNVVVMSNGLPELVTASPPEFDGPEGVWSPETMLTGAVANCYILTFRAVARASRLAWDGLECSVVGVLDRIDRVTRFTEMHLYVKLQLPAGSDAEKAQRLLEKAEQACLITNSLTAKVELHAEVWSEPAVAVTG
ncbi:MAG: osmotically inducible protein OsmC [Chloroflexi bacterium]|nr:MAG: osmotically inducible protein OsmC [Chloroflexota bacterium]